MKNIVTLIFGICLCQIILLLSLFFLPLKKEYKISNNNQIKALSTDKLLSYFEEKEIKKEEPKVELSKDKVENIKKEEPQKEDIPVVKEEYLDSYTTSITVYTAECKDCSGKLGCFPYQDVRNGNIYYQDKNYGKIRIVSADKSLPCGSIVKLMNLKDSTEPIIAIVLDRGGAVSFDKGLGFDLLTNDTFDTKKFGIQKNIFVNLVRRGW